MDTDGDGQFQASEVGSQIGRLLKKAHAQVCAAPARGGP